MAKKKKKQGYEWLTMTSKDYRKLQDIIEKKIEDGYGVVIQIVGKPGGCPTGGCQ